jgi:hypothetical protein
VCKGTVKDAMMEEMRFPDVCEGGGRVGGGCKVKGCEGEEVEVTYARLDDEHGVGLEKDPPTHEGVYAYLIVIPYSFHAQISVAPAWRIILTSCYFASGWVG